MIRNLLVLFVLALLLTGCASTSGGPIKLKLGESAKITGYGPESRTLVNITVFSAKSFAEKEYFDVRSSKPETLSAGPGYSFYEFDVEVSNKGMDSFALDSFDFALIDASNNRYDPLGYLGKDSLAPDLEKLKPGEKRRGVLIFKIPNQKATGLKIVYGIGYVSESRQWVVEWSLP